MQRPRKNSAPSVRWLTLPLKSAIQTVRPLGKLDGSMAAKDESVACIFCKTGRLTKQMEQITFRQMSDKGYVRCSVTVLVATCDNCQMQSTDPEANKIFAEAFKREYDKLP